MGPISVDGSGQNNPDRSEGPWGGVDLYSNGGIPRSLRPDTERDNRFGLRGVNRRRSPEGMLVDAELHLPRLITILYGDS
jgi:hypothetical protein